MKKQVAVGVLALGAVWMLAGCGTAEVDLTQFVDIKCEGVDGKGMAYATLDEDELDDAIKDANEDLTKKERKKLIQSIEAEIKKNSIDLSNGDKLTVEIEWSESKAERYDIKFVGDEKEVKVSGLKELKKIDAFEDIEIEYDGASPYVKVEVENNSKNDFLQDCYYSVEYPDDRYYAKAGDEVEITVSYSEYDAEEEGYTVKEDTKKIKIKDSDVDAYITKPEEVSGDAVSELEEACKSVVDEEIFDNVYTYRKLMSEATGLEYGWDFDMATVTKGEYKVNKKVVLVAKDIDHGAYNYNKVYYILEQTLQDAVCTNPVTVYYAVSFSDVILCADGTLDVSLEYANDSGYASNLEDVDAYLEKEASRTYEVVEEQ